MTGDIVPRTRGWQANLLTPVAGGSPTLRITGEIELGNKNEVPRLSPSDVPSSDPSSLVLDLAVVVEGPSELAMHWAALKFESPVRGVSPLSARVIWMGVEIAALNIPKGP